MRAEPVGGLPAAAVPRRALLRLRARRAELGARLLRLLHAAHDSGEREGERERERDIAGGAREC